MLVVPGDGAVRQDVVVAVVPGAEVVAALVAVSVAVSVDEGVVEAVVDPGVPRAVAVGLVVAVVDGAVSAAHSLSLYVTRFAFLLYHDISAYRLSWGPQSHSLGYGADGGMPMVLMFANPIAAFTYVAPGWWLYPLHFGDATM